MMRPLRRTRGGDVFSPFFAQGSAFGNQGTPITSNIILGPLTVRRTNSFALVFTNYVSSSDAGFPSPAPSGGWTIIQSSSGLSVFSNVFGPGSVEAIIAPSNAWQLVATMVLFSKNGASIAQGKSQTLVGGNNSVSFPNPFTAGNGVIICISGNGLSTFPVGSIKDNNGNVWRRLCAVYQPSSAFSNLISEELWFCPTVRGGSSTLTVVINGNPVFAGFFGLEYVFQ